MCAEMEIAFLGQIPLDPRIGRACDLGHSFMDEWPLSEAALAYKSVISEILQSL